MFEAHDRRDARPLQIRARANSCNKHQKLPKLFTADLQINMTTKNVFHKNILVTDR